MNEKKSTLTAKKEYSNTHIYTNILPFFPVRCNTTKFTSKPEKDFYKIHSELKNNEDELLTIQQILQRFTEGHCIKLGSFKQQDFTTAELQEMNEARKEDFSEYEFLKAKFSGAKQLELVSTDLLVMDIDDRQGRTDPQEVFQASGALAMYFSYSHKTESTVFNATQNAYRLIYKLDEQVTNEKLLIHIQTALQGYFYSNYKELKPVAGVGKGNCGVDAKGANFFFGSRNKNYFINENYTPIVVKPYAESFAKEQEIIAYAEAKRKANQTMNASTNDKEALEMAEFLGDTNGLLDFKQFTTVAIGLMNTAQQGEITEDTALEVLKLIDGNAHNDTFYMSFKRPLQSVSGAASIGSFIKLAIDQGFKRKFNNRFAIDSAYKELEIKTEIIQCDRYISAQNVTDILTGNDRRILLVSATNSGKTYATINGSKAYLKQNKDCFVYFASPTRALGSQIASKYSLGKSLQDDKQAHRFVNKAIENDSRMICGTYDKATMVLRALPSGYKLIVIADEAHKEVSDYQLRYTAIKKLFSITESDKVYKFIGLTGTPQEIDLSHYDKRFIVKTTKQDIAKELLFVEYNKSGLYTDVTTRMIAKEVNQGSKVLAFVNNKAQIDIIQKALKQIGVTAVAITADERKSSTYISILNAETIPENVQVILATVAIADGISIENAKEYVCIIAPHYKLAPFFNISLIKQASNRFRKTYKRLIIPIFIKPELEEDRKTDNQPYLNGRYSWLVKESNRTLDLIKQQFESSLDLYKPSIAEAVAGLFNTGLSNNFNFKRAYAESDKRTAGQQHDKALVETLDLIKERLLTVDERAIRQQASKEQEKYYSYYPYAFKRAVTEITGIQTVNNRLMADYIADEDKDDRAALIAELKRLRELAEIEEQAKRKRVAEILTETIFDELQRDFYGKGKANEDNELWQTLKKVLHKDHIAVLKRVVGFLTHEQTIKELTRVQKVAQIPELTDHLKAYADLQAFDKANAASKRNKTQTIIGRISKALDQHKGPITTDERKELIIQVASTFKNSKDKAIIEQTFKRFFVHGEPKIAKVNGKATRFNDYRLIDLAYITGCHGFTPEEIQGMYNKQHYNLNLRY